MEDQEQAEWDGVNKLLQNHGFKPVHFADPVENKNLSDLVLLDKRAACEVRASLRTMLADSDRREALIQELLHSNALHKDKSQELLGQAAHHSQRAAELEGLLGGLKAKVQDLEDRFLANAAQHHQVQEDARSRCASLELKLSQESEAAEQLQKKLCFAVREEETRVARQTRTFQQIHQRSARPDSPVDLQVLDVIDFYESQMAEMRDEMRSLKENLEKSGENALPLSGKRASNNTALPLKGALKSYREQLNKSKAQEEELKSKVQKLKQELEMRPTVKELKTYKHQLRRMDRIKQNTSRSPGRGERTEMTSRDAGMCSQQVPETVLFSQYRRLLNEMGSLLMAPWAPVPLRRQKPGPDASEPVEFCELLPALETWNKQLGMLKELHGALSKLTQRLIPWQPSHGTRGPGEPVRVDELMLMVDTLLEETSIEDEKVLRSPTRHTLESMVSHFQKLFDVRSLRGVYPRMNEVYTKLGEMANAMRNLRDILGLDDRAVPSAVVNRVAHVASSSTGEASRLQYHNLLAEGDIDSIIVKVKEHNEFFPAFHALATDLMQTLGVNRLDDILPALRSVTRWTH